MICKIMNFWRIFFNRKKFVKFEFSIYVLKFRKLPKMHFSTSISSAISAWSSKVMVDHDTTGAIGCSLLEFDFRISF